MNSDLVDRRTAQMTKKVVRPVKKPSMKKGSTVAKRAIKKPFESKKRKKHKKRVVRPIAPVRPCRLERLNDRKRKHDAEKKRWSKLARAGLVGRTVDRFFAGDVDILLDVEISVTVGPTEHHSSMCDLVTGDNGFPDDK